SIADANQPKLELNKEDREKIFEILKEAKLFKAIQSLQDEEIKSVPVFHYLITLDAQGFSEFITKLEEVGQNKFKDQNLPIEFSQEKIDEMKKQLEKIEDMPVEIWIEKETYFLRKAAISHFETNVDKPDGINKADVLLTFELNKINEPVNIQAPQDGQSLEGVLEKAVENLSEKWTSQMLLNNTDKLGTAEDDDKDGLTNQEEIFYGTDINNPDTDGDGFSDGDEVKNGYNPNGYNKL
ncbi:MAG: thrombospondin type 3 repeat-containing protein, partial [bacterium]